MMTISGMRQEKIMTKFKRNIVRIVSVLGAAGFMFTACTDSVNLDQQQNQANGNSASTSYASKTDASIQTNREQFFNSDVIYKLPDTLSNNEDISVIVTMSADSLIDAYKAKDTKKTLTEFVASKEAKALSTVIARDQNVLIQKLNKSGVKYTLGEKYDTVLNGFEITIKAKDFEKVDALFDGDASLIVGEEYEPAATEVVTNDVDVYETGIFDSSSSEYQGDGVVVAVLDTGLDYTHTAFSADNFTTSKEAFTLDSVSKKVGQTAAARFTNGLTGEDVYMNKKVPFAYDYADKDPDVLPINSEHGTHVAGVIAGNDDTITGVAPNAQLAIMKVFSDTQTGAKSSWLLAALEDCVTLGVDVINMSLGSSCGFAREVDEVEVNKIYDSIRDAGISLIAAASNDYNATHASDKNGSLGLTSNPDSGTVGSPSTYAASLSVASVDGVKTPYLKYNEDIIYFNEATTSDAKMKDFVDDILKTQGDVDSWDFEYETIPGIGRSSDYPKEKEYYKGKIVLVKRGTSTFEDKVRVALQEKGAAGIIIYNNVSGTISMSVGADVGAVCSISQDEGEKLAAAGSGTIRISRSQVAGPFMSDFSSWGPTSDLQIKPEITAHGGEILSAVPGQEYDRLSGTSMAAPNQAGATALIRQYVKYSGIFGNDLSEIEVTELVNQLMMSTTDIVYNKNGLPYAVRKQGSGLVNITKAATTEAYLTTFDKDGEVMDKTKLELGDDKEKTGVYEMTFAINNISNGAVTYDIASIIQTEGVSTTYTSHGDTTVTQDGYLLEGTQTTVTGVAGGEQKGNTVTVAANKTAKVTVKIELSDTDKAYMDVSFAHGMYVEGFVTLKAVSGAKVNLNVPMLAFYGDWTEAPIFDEEYYDTHKDEINAGLDAEDKMMPDAYATRVIGGLYSDYISTLGTYYFVQDPAATQIAASKDHIAISNQEMEENSTVNSIYSIWAGLLRNVKELNISIVEDATGKEIFSKTSYNQRKSYSSGLSLYQSSIDVEFSALEHNLKNNTRYTVTVSTYIDYGEKEDQKNVRNVFQFPLYIDFQAPVVENVTYRTEYDKATKKTKLFADLEIYDNHYAMGMQLGQIIPADEDSEYTFDLSSFGKYVTPIYSSFNSTSKVTVELTDYISRIKQSAGMDQDSNDPNAVEYNNNSFIAVCYDYAMNSATYEIRLPDEVLSMYFTEDEVRLSPNETMDISSILNIYPNDSWLQVLDFKSENTDIADIVNQTVIAKQSGVTTITVTGKNKQGDIVTASLDVKVLAEGEEGYKKYDVPAVNKFTLTGYYVNKAYYSVSTEEREIGLTDSTYDFGTTAKLSMFPSESVTLQYTLDSNFPEKTEVVFQSGSDKIATVTPDGTIVAKAEGTVNITAKVLFEGKSTLYSSRVSIDVKDPYTTSGMYLMSYKGLGGEVVIPDDRGITMIYSYAFSNYEYVEKDLENGDVIDKEDPYHIKQMYIGDDTITKVVIPEGVTDIESYAFANLTALEEVVLPSTLTRIGLGAFYGCEKLKTINLEHAKFINEKAFAGCALEEVNLANVVSIGNYTFEDCKLNGLKLPLTSQSLGVGAFYNNQNLTWVEFEAPKIKIGSYAFAKCSQLSEIDINAAVISSYAFYDCDELSDVTLGKDVAVIGEYAFGNTKVASFNIDEDNPVLKVDENNAAFLLKNEELILVAPMYSGTAKTVTTEAVAIAAGAFAGNENIYRVKAPNAKTIGAYAFAGCTILTEVEMGNVETIGDYAFAGTALTATPNLAKVSSIGAYAFAGTKVKNVTIADNTTIGEYAFSGYGVKTTKESEMTYCTSLESVTLGDNVTVGKGAFYTAVYLYDYDHTESLEYYEEYVYPVFDDKGNEVERYVYLRYKFNTGVISKLKTVVIGSNVTLGESAFAGNAKITNLSIVGDGVEIGDYAFFNAAGIENVDLSGVRSIGAYAFSGSSLYDFYKLDRYTLQYAYTREWIDGEIVATGYITSDFAPSFKEADLSGAVSVGKGAFAGNDGLTTVSFGGDITEISAETFANCQALTQLTLHEMITSIGDYAFYNTKIDSIGLTNVDKIGKYAFAGTKLTSVGLKNDVEIADGAFANCTSLAQVDNLENAKTIGAQAFSGVALKEVTLTNVTYLGDFAFGGSAITNVTFGDKLVELGENPFYGCAIETYGKTVDVLFNNKVVGTRIEENYDISETVHVIDGVLYQTVSTGLELVSYPMAKDAESYVVKEGTVRITAKAFAGSALENVTLASTLKALGDKAFYECEKLAVVVFKSYVAPDLEEEFDTLYLNLPLTGSMAGYEGLGIAPYYMWNVTSSFSNFYFGANFVDYIGHVEGNLVMVKPANGQNYNTFIFSQYFGTTVDGDNAATEATLKVIATINALPEANKIRLEHKELVAAARDAYNKLPSVEQQALVEKANLSKLRDAEAQIRYLEEIGKEPVTGDPIDSDNGLPTYAIVLIVVGGVLVVAAAVVAVLFALKKKKGAESVGTAEKETAATENAAETDEQTVTKDTNDAVAEEPVEETAEEAETVEESVEESAEASEETVETEEVLENNEDKENE